MILGQTVLKIYDCLTLLRTTPADAGHHKTPRSVAVLCLIMHNDVAKLDHFCHQCPDYAKGCHPKPLIGITSCCYYNSVDELSSILPSWLLSAEVGGELDEKQDVVGDELKPTKKDEKV